MDKLDSLIRAFEITIANSTFEELQNCAFEKIRIDSRDGTDRNLKGFKYGSLLRKSASDRRDLTYFVTYKNVELYEISNKQFDKLTMFINEQMSKKRKIIIHNCWGEINEILKNEGN